MELHGRRQRVLTAAAAAALAVAMVAAPTVRASSPPVVADAGNFILFDGEPALAANLGPSVHLDTHTLPAFGFHSYASAWRAVLGRDVLSHHPAAIVVMMGNDDFALARSDPDTMRSLLDEAVRLMTAHGAKILWLGLPPLPNVDDEIGRAAVNRLYAELPKRFPGVVRYVSTDEALGFAGVWVRRRPDDPSRLPIRKVQADGSPDEHVCQQGAVRLAELVRSQLAGWIGGLPAAPEHWTDGDWWFNLRYDDPPGACWR
jgi:hypothetical protein